MQEDSNKRYRLTIELSPAQHKFLLNLPFGWRKQLFGALIDMMIDMTHRCGAKSLSAIVSQKINLEEYFNPRQL